MENKKKNLSSKIEKQEEGKVSRRGFLKKAAYSTPVLMAMGQLAKPEKASADSSDGPDGPPGWNP